jgi:hypothetical protein
MSTWENGNRWYYKFKFDGKPIVSRFGYDTKEDAKIAQEERRAFLRTGEGLKTIEHRPIEIQLQSDCMVITNRQKTKAGYIQRRQRLIRTSYHRYIYELNYGPIPDGAIIRHSCNNPSCINPLHLKIGTHADNVNDRVVADRSAKGVRNGRSKLTEAQVLEIRSDTNTPLYELAFMYNVSRKAISQIRKGNTWKHLIK